MELVQTVTLDPSLAAFALSYSPYGISIRDITRDDRMAITKIRLLGPSLVAVQVVETPPVIEEVSPENEDPPSGSGLTPPSSPRPITPVRHSSLLTAGKPVGLGIKGLGGPFSTTTIETLVLGPNGIMALSPMPVVLKLEKLCSERRLDEATALVDEERRRGRRGEVDDKVGVSKRGLS